MILHIINTFAFLPTGLFLLVCLAFLVFGIFIVIDIILSVIWVVNTVKNLFHIL